MSPQRTQDPSDEVMRFSSFGSDAGLQPSAPLDLSRSHRGPGYDLAHPGDASPAHLRAPFGHADQFVVAKEMPSCGRGSLYLICSHNCPRSPDLGSVRVSNRTFCAATAWRCDLDGGNLVPGREAVVQRLFELDGQGELRA